MHTCQACGKHITEQTIFKVEPDLEYHRKCLKCFKCHISFDNMNLNTCYIKDGNLYCKGDYKDETKIYCSGCDDILEENDYVMKAEERLYHVKCFRCSICHVVLMSGDKFRLEDNKILCYNHPEETQAKHYGDKHTHELNDGDNDIDEETKIDKDVEHESLNCMYPLQQTTLQQQQQPLKQQLVQQEQELQQKQQQQQQTTTSDKNVVQQQVLKGKFKATRMRTVLNEKQLATLKACYSRNPRPDAIMKEQLVEMTGLSPRVIRVWFQNKRCKDKKSSISRQYCVQASLGVSNYSNQCSPQTTKINFSNDTTYDQWNNRTTTSSYTSNIYNTDLWYDIIGRNSNQTKYEKQDYNEQKWIRDTLNTPYGYPQSNI